MSLWDFHSSTTRTARKPYVCENCSGAIEPGARYVYNAGKFESCLTVYRVCLTCDLVATEWLHAFDAGEGWPLGELFEDLRDEGINDPVAWATQHRADRLAKRAERDHQAAAERLTREVVERIKAERLRQVEAEGWSPDHDDGHDGGELGKAAGCYALYAIRPPNDLRFRGHPPPGWPWHPQWWKPKDPVRDLERAGALIVAELERLQRLADRSAEVAGS
jgi:hypothetical protein